MHETGTFFSNDSVTNDINADTPEKTLLIATLNRAVLDLMGNQRAQKEDAKQWLFEERDSHAFFSFNWICVHLGLEPRLVLSRIRSMCGRKSDTRALRQWSNVRKQSWPVAA